MDEANERTILEAIRKWDKLAIQRLIRDGRLTPDMRLTDPRKKWEMPPIGHIIESMGYGAHEPLNVMYAMHKNIWDPWVPYVIKRTHGGRIQTTAFSHLLEHHVERSEKESALFNALQFFEQTKNASAGFNVPFVFEEWDADDVPIHSKWSALSGQSLCAVILQQIERPLELFCRVLDAGGRFHAGDPPGLFVVAIFKDYLRDPTVYGADHEIIGRRVHSWIRAIEDRRDQIPSEVVCAIEPRSQRNLLHWMAAISAWPSLGKCLDWLEVLHEYGVSVFTPDGDGHTAVELAASNRHVKDNCLIAILRPTEERERRLHEMIATKYQVMNGLGFPREISERVLPYGDAWLQREKDTAKWFYRRRAPHVSAHTSWDCMSKWHPF